MQKAEKGCPGQRDGGGNECCVQVRARPVCWGSWSRAGEQARFAEAIGEQPRWGIWVNSTSGKCLWVASLESFDTPIFSGASQLGRTAWHKDVGIWQMPGTFSHFRAGPEPSASSERPWHWVFPGGMEGCLGGERRGEGLHPRTACLWGVAALWSLPSQAPPPS